MQKYHVKEMVSKGYYSSISLVIPLDGNSPFYAEYMTVLMEFLRKFRGILELIIIDSGINEGALRAIWIYSRLLKKIDPKVRIRILRTTGRIRVTESISYGLRIALGEKVIVVLLDYKRNGYRKKVMRLLSEAQFFLTRNIYLISDFPSVSYLQKVIMSD